MSTTEKRSPDYRRVVELVKEIGSKNGFEPIPWDQIEWHGRSDQSPLQRMWCWLVSKTLRKGHWSPYAITKPLEDGGEELHIENAANTLGMDVANAYRTWKQGLQLGLWRYGTAKEGKRRLYICGKVTPQEGANEGEDKANGIVCTDNLPSTILNKIKDWPPEKRAKITAGWIERIEVRNVALAEVVKATRDILAEDDDTYFRAWGLEVSRQEHTPQGVAEEELKARQERLTRLREPIRLYVQTVQTFVQSDQNGVYKTSYSEPATPAPLLPLDPLRQPQDCREQANNLPPAGTEKPQERMTGKGRSSYPRSKQAAAPAADVKVEAQTPAKSDAEWRAENKAAHEELTAELRKMQATYPKTDFGMAEFEPDSKPGRIFLARVLTAIGGRDGILPFGLYVAMKFKGLDRHAMGKLPSRAPGMAHGPRGLGLIWEWAQDFGKRGKARGATS